MGSPMSDGEAGGQSDRRAVTRSIMCTQVILGDREASTHSPVPSRVLLKCKAGSQWAH